MQTLYGMLRAIQSLTFTGLIEITMPSHVLLFQQGCIMFAQVDIFNGSELVQKIFTLRQTKAYTDNFGLMGIHSMNFFLNSGSFFIFAVLVVVHEALKAPLNRLLLCCPKNRLSRGLGVKLGTS